MDGRPPAGPTGGAGAPYVVRPDRGAARRPPSRSTARRACRSGLFIFTRRADTDAATVLAAISRFRGGRLSGSPTPRRFPGPVRGQVRSVTSPVSWTPPASVAPPGPLIVRPDRARARRWLTFILIANGVISIVCLVGAMWASSTTGEWWGGLAMAITLPGAVFQMTFHAFFYGRLLGSETIAEIGPAGVRGPTTRWDRVDLPWGSIASVSNGWNAVVVKPGAGGGRKVVIPARATDTSVATIRAAISHFSGGRL